MTAEYGQTAPMTNDAHHAPFDTALLKQRRAKGAFGPDFLLRLAGEELLLRLTEGNAASAAGGVLALCGPAWLAEQAARAWKGGTLLRCHWLAVHDGTPHTPQVVCDHARLPFAENSLDAALVLFDFAFVNDLPAALRHWRRALKPGGRLLAALPGGETLHELRAAWAAAERQLAQQCYLGDSWAGPGWRVAPFVDLQQLARLAGMAGFAQVVTDVERLRARYADALALMRELKDSGWANPLRARPRQPVSRHLLGLAAAHYELAFAEDDGRVPATYELLYLSARKPGADEKSANDKACVI